MWYETRICEKMVQFKCWYNLLRNKGMNHTLWIIPYDHYLKRGSSSQWSSSLYCPMRNSDEMTTGKIHPTLEYATFSEFTLRNHRWYKNKFQPTEKQISMYYMNITCLTSITLTILDFVTASYKFMGSKYKKFKTYRDKFR